MSPESPNTYPALFWGYFLVWTLLAIYVLYLAIKCSRLERKMKSILNTSSSNS